MINLIQFTAEELEIGDVYLNSQGEARRVVALKSLDGGLSYVVDSVRLIDGAGAWKATWDCNSAFLVLIDGEEA